MLTKRRRSRRTLGNDGKSPIAVPVEDLDAMTRGRPHRSPLWTARRRYGQVSTSLLFPAPSK